MIDLISMFEIMTTSDESIIDRMKCDCKNLEFEEFETRWFVDWETENAIDLLWRKLKFSWLILRTKRSEFDDFWCNDHRVITIDKWRDCLMSCRLNIVMQLESFIVELNWIFHED